MAKSVSIKIPAEMGEKFFSGKTAKERFELEHGTLLVSA